MKRTITTVAVLGSGIMGSRIACHLANIGVQVLLLDRVPDQAPAAGTAGSRKVRNALVDDSLKHTLKASPAALYRASFAGRITTGNFEDDLHRIATADWIIEVVVENLEVKRSLFEKVEQYRSPGALVTSNTSGIPIHLMSEGRSDDFQRHFCGTHFFNPPRYLRLLEIIPGPKTGPEVTDFLLHYGEIFLGKSTVLCKDTPAFIANRIGVFSILSLFHLVEQNGMTVEEVDQLTGPVLGRPKSATFRTCDVVGLDTLVKVANGLSTALTEDEARERFAVPAFVAAMIKNGWMGDKTGQGFYKKTKGKDGRTEILSLDLSTLDYRPKAKSRYRLPDEVRTIENLHRRLPQLVRMNGPAGEFYRAAFYSLFSYASFRIPEISDTLYRIDEAITAGFGWEAGIFETWDMLGVQDTLAAMQAEGYAVATWVSDMLAAGHASFYRREHGRLYYYDIAQKDVRPVHADNGLILLDTYREKTVWKNSGCSLIDLGDGVLNLEFHTKMNAIGGEIVEGVRKAVELAEQEYRGLVIANEGANFSAGANLALVFMLAAEQEYEELDMAIRAFQDMNMRIRYSPVPVVVAPHGMALGGGCEMTLHADKVLAHAETYIGMVEFGVGLIPGGGGSKEMTLRASDAYTAGRIDELVLRDYFLTIARASVSTSAREAFDLRILMDGRDEIVMHLDHRIREAKQAVLRLSEDGYTQPAKRRDIKVLGRSGLGMIFAGVEAMLAGQYISEHDALISRKLGVVMCGGELSAPARVSEQYLLDLEREAFLSLCGERKTLERIQSILVSGKPLRN